MAETEDSVSNDLWNSSVCRKSWADMVEEDENGSKEEVSLRMTTPNRTGKTFRLPTVKETEPYADEEANFGDGERHMVIPKIESLPTFGKNIANGSKTPVKKQPDLPQEDISLTGHLDVKLGLDSPVKAVGNGESSSTRSGRRVFTVKSTAPRASPSKVAKRKAEPSAGIPDELLMPSPSKVLRSTPKKGTEDKASPGPRDMLTRKRVRDMLTPTPKRQGKIREKREPETDPEILARRQRQIDYGKNTLGYERYRQMVSKEDREKIHPKTPPIGIKFSRRAWDGLIRVWRQRLHFWDPPSEGGGNPECLEVQSDISDCSSVDGSQPNTPVQDVKRKRSGRFIRTAPTRLPCSSAADDDDGCTPFED